MWLCGSSKVADGLPLELVEGKDYVIGRDRDCHVRVYDLSVSRRHAMLRVLADSVVVEDLKSSNGTFVNTRRVVEVAVRAGDRVGVGMVHFDLLDTPLAHIDSVDVVATTARMRREDIDHAATKLTASQRKVLKFLLEGLDEQQIALECGLSPRTIHNHIQGVYRAFKVHSRQQLLTHFLGTTSIAEDDGQAPQ